MEKKDINIRYAGKDDYIWLLEHEKHISEKILKSKIDNMEKYDPQKVGADGRPNMYVYMVHNEDFFFSVHLYSNNKFTKKIDKYYYKMELSNLDIDNHEYKFYTYETLKNNPQYLELVNKKLRRNALFSELEEQNKYNSKN
ncbi:MAG: hypothetical protein LBB89_09645 [Treponema sp.]|nr:hypothetical protein [Treponema sp.]